MRYVSLCYFCSCRAAEPEALVTVWQVQNMCTPLKICRIRSVYPISPVCTYVRLYRNRKLKAALRKRF